MSSLSRRYFLQGASAATICVGPQTVNAGIDDGRTLTSTTSGNPLQTQRNGINVNQFGLSQDFAFINHIINGEQSFGPSGTNFRTGTPWPAQIDANGYPNNSGAAGLQWGGGVTLPAPNKFGGVYIVAWEGDGTINIANAYTFTPESGRQYTSTYTGSKGIFKNVAGKSAYIGLRFTNSFYGNDNDASVGWSFSVTGGSGGFVRNLRWYRLEDEADLLAGKVYRAGFKQPLANLNPSFIRLMNWTGGNSSNHIRFEDRTAPSKTGVQQNWPGSPVYSSDATGVNQFEVAAARPTSANPKTSPAFMKHGEICTFRTSSTSTSARCGNGTGSSDGGIGLLNIEKSAVVAGSHPVVQTAQPHGFDTGDKVVHINLVGMTQLNLVPCTITVIDSTLYAIDVDTSGYGKFAPGKRSNATQFTTLQVGTGNDRVAYPLVLTRGDTFISQLGNYIHASNYHSAIFNKDIVLQYTASGTPVPGAWIATNTTSYGGFGCFFSDVPLEYCVALVNEVNAMLPAGRPPVHMYWNVPAMGLNSFDHDYSAGSNWAVNGMNVILNGADGFAGLDTKSSVFVEYYNETWNRTPLSNLLSYIGSSKYGTSTNDLDTYASIRMVQCFKDLQAAYPGNPRIKYMLGLSGPGGTTRGTANDFRINGTAAYLTSGYGPPINHADACVYAPYVDVSGTAYYTTRTGTNCLTDDCAMYLGIDNSGTLSMTGGTAGAASTTVTITAVAVGTPVVNQTLVGSGISGGTYIIGMRGTAPNLTVTLNQPATIPNGTTIRSPANGGGNYTGAANQTLAISNFVAQNDNGPLGAGTNGVCLNWYYVNMMTRLADNLIPAGKYLCQYEGGSNWQTRAAGYPVGYPALSVAAINSAQWGTAQINFWKRCANYSPKLTMPSLYLSVATGFGNTDQQWAYAIPDTYAKVADVWAEGQALANNGLWSQASARNQGIF